jgi:hypothetical protein
MIAVLCAIVVKFILLGSSPSQAPHQESRPIAKDASPYAFPPDVAAGLEDTESLVIYLVGVRPQASAGQSGEEETFHGYTVFGSARVTSPRAVQSIIGSLLRGVEHQGEVMACFYPRHGVRASLRDGRQIDLVICYLCGYMRVYVAREGMEPTTTMNEVRTADDSRQPLNEVLRAAGVDLKQKVAQFWPEP